MFDQEDNDTEPRVARPLPRALRERLFVQVDTVGKMPIFAVRFSELGCEGWPEPVGSINGPRGIVRWRNPTDRAVSFTVVLGVDPRLMVHFERRLVPPEHRVPDGLAMKWLGRRAPLRREFVRLFVEVAAGETVDLPAEFTGTVRQVEQGYVVSGRAPQLVIEGETAIPIHPGLLPAPAAAAPARAAAKRRSS